MILESAYLNFTLQLIMQLADFAVEEELEAVGGLVPEADVRLQQRAKSSGLVLPHLGLATELRVDLHLVLIQLLRKMTLPHESELSVTLKLRLRNSDCESQLVDNAVIQLPHLELGQNLLELLALVVNLLDYNGLLRLKSMK